MLANIDSKKVTAQPADDPKRTAAQAINKIIIERQFGAYIKAYCEQDPKALALFQNPALTPHWETLARKINLHPHCLDQDDYEQRSAFEMIAGERCYVEACQAYENENINEYLAWLRRGESFHDYLCTDRLNHEDRTLLTTITTTSDKTELPDIDAIFARALHATHYHYSAGFGMMAETAFRIAQYYQKKFPHRTDEIDRWHTLSFVAINAALEIRPYCQRIEENAQGGQTLLRAFSWIYAETTSLEQLKTYYAAMLVNAGANATLQSYAAEEGKRIARQLLHRDESSHRVVVGVNN